MRRPTAPAVVRLLPVNMVLPHPVSMELHPLGSTEHLLPEDPEDPEATQAGRHHHNRVGTVDIRRSSRAVTASPLRAMVGTLLTPEDHHLGEHLVDTVSHLSHRGTDSVSLILLSPSFSHLPSFLLELCLIFTFLSPGLFCSSG